MRKKRQLLSIALIPCMVGSLLAGCTVSSEDTTVTPSATEANTGEIQSQEDDAAESRTEGDGTEPTTETPDTTAADTQEGGAVGTAMVDIIKGCSSIEAYTMEANVSLSEVSTLDGEMSETEVVFGIKSLADGNGNMSMTISADFDVPDVASLRGDLFTISMVDNYLYLDLSSLYDMVMEELGEDSAMIEQYAAAFEVSMEELESLMVLGIPLGNLEVSKEDYAGIQEAMELIYADIAAAIDSMDESTASQEGDVYTVTINNDNAVEAIGAILLAFEGDMGEIYDAYISGMKEVDYSDLLQSVLTAVMDEVIAGAEAAAGVEMDEAARAELESQIEAGMDEYRTSMEEAIAELESGRDEFVDEFNSAVEFFRESKEEAQAQIDNGDTSLDCVVSLSAEGETGSRKVSTEMTMVVKSNEEISIEDAEDTANMSTSTSLSCTAVIQEGPVEITAPESYAPLSKAVEIAYRVYLLYQEAAGDDPDVDDDDFDYGTYSQSELEKNYGVTAEDDQLLLCYTPDIDGVLITAFDGMEFFQSEDMGNMAMEFNDDVTAYITIYVYDSSYDVDFYTAYEPFEQLEENLYYMEESGESLALVYFADNITIEIDLDADSEEVLQEITGGENEETMKEILALCEIVPAP